MMEESFEGIASTSALLLREKRGPVQCSVEFILATRPVLTAHPGCKAVNCFQFS